MMAIRQRSIGFKLLVSISLVLIMTWQTVSVFAASLSYDGVTVSRPDYDYAPSVMVDTDGLKMWWCAYNPSITGDAVYYAKWNGSGWGTPQVVLQRSASGWDSSHACDPSVVKGSFNFNGGTYAYAMYYTGSNNAIGYDSKIGVAFSNDGINWVKYGSPIISSLGNASATYGAGMQTAYRLNGTGSTVHLAYYDSTQGAGGSNYAMASSDGIHFNGRALLPQPVGHTAIGDIAYNPATGTWWITTKLMNDEIIYVYTTSTSSLTSTWTLVGQVNSALTGQIRNHNPAFMRMFNGDIYIEPGTNKKFLYFGMGNTNPGSYDIGHVTIWP